MYLQKLVCFQQLPDGTYTLDRNPVHFHTGFQLSFHIIGQEYTSEEYDNLVKNVSTELDSPVYVGVYKGFPHVSFRTQDQNKAVFMCKKYNQVSYWDWKNISEVLL